jgi:NADH pyrophosphatase NudC (nudix superfamily)
MKEPIMSNTATFLFCPYDGQRLAPRTDDEGTTRPCCPVCGFIDYANPKPCVAVLIEQDGRLLLGRRAKEPAKELWDILGGFIDAGETAEQAIHREVEEETGLHVLIGRYLGSFPDTYGPRGVPTLNLGFVTVPTGGTLRPASDVAELRWFAPAELPTAWAFPHQVQVIDAWRQGGPRPVASPGN